MAGSSNVMEQTHATQLDIKDHWRRALTIGIALTLFGLLSLAFPFSAALTAELVICGILITSGISGFVHSYQHAHRKDFALSLAGSLTSFGIGFVLLIYTFTEQPSLTLLLAPFFLTGGIFRIVLAFKLSSIDHWPWVMISGILGLVFAVLVLLQWPQTESWVMGMLIGVDLISAGLVAILMAMTARRLSTG